MMILTFEVRISFDFSFDFLWFFDLKRKSTGMRNGIVMYHKHCHGDIVLEKNKFSNKIELPWQFSLKKLLSKPSVILPLEDI